MRFIRVDTAKTSADVMSGILNCVCPECGGSMGEPVESSSARVNVGRIGVRFGTKSFRTGIGERRTRSGRLDVNGWVPGRATADHIWTDRH
jgi:hypothetical protein